MFLVVALTTARPPSLSTTVTVNADLRPTKWSFNVTSSEVTVPSRTSTSCGRVGVGSRWRCRLLRQQQTFGIGHDAIEQGDLVDHGKPSRVLRKRTGRKADVHLVCGPCSSVRNIVVGLALGTS